MTLQQTQQHLINRISSVTDENILHMLEAELSFYLEHKEQLNTQINEADLNELKMLVNEPDDKNVVSLSRFKEIVAGWNMK